MKSLRLNPNLVFSFLATGIYVLSTISTVQAGPLPGGFTPREMFSRGAIEGREFRVRSKLRQLRIQDSRMPQDVRSIATVPLGTPGDTRPETINSLSRDHTKFIAGGWMWNSGAVDLYAGITGPAKGFTYPLDNGAENFVTDPESAKIARETPITEWWEFSAREQRAEFFRAKFGAAQQLQSMPGLEEGETGQAETMGFSSPAGGGMMP